MPKKVLANITGGRDTLIQIIATHEGVLICPYCNKIIIGHTCILNNVVHCRSCYEQQILYYTGRIGVPDFGPDLDYQKHREQT